MAGHFADGQSRGAAQVLAPVGTEDNMCCYCQISRPSSKLLNLLQERWYGRKCPYCYQRRSDDHDSIKQLSLTRRIEVETWMAGKLLRRRTRKPKGKILCAQPEDMFAEGESTIAFAGQLMRTRLAASNAQLSHLLEPLNSYMQELGL